jgi:hypothetical protein
MFPWLWIYAPVTHWPWSGAVRENVSPDTFFGGIKPEAGDGEIEQQVFDRASYGRQLGWLTDVVLGAIDPNAAASAAARAALESLRNLAGEITRIKVENRTDRVDAAIALLDRLAAESPDDLRRVLAHYHS